VGLGLTICRAIIEAHQGRIVGMNRPGAGATFTFTLPLGHPPAAATEIEVQAAHG
jgi:two-component system, OmpR family, sensor histidine kinase KdpD